MNINKKEITKVIKSFHHYHYAYIENGDWRKGQFLQNLLNNWFPPITEPFRTTDKDPFYLDERIPNFIEAICDEEALQIWYSNEFVIKNFTNEKRNS